MSKIHPVTEANILLEFAYNVQRAALETKLATSPWAPTCSCNVPILPSRAIPRGWFCFYFAVMVLVSHHFYGVIELGDSGKIKIQQCRLPNA